jgi:hypothetical protein
VLSALDVDRASPKGFLVSWTDDVIYRIEVDISEELVLAELTRSDDPVVESDRDWRPNPTTVGGYEARQMLRGGVGYSCRRSGRSRTVDRARLLVLAVGAHDRGECREPKIGAGTNIEVTEVAR